MLIDELISEWLERIEMHKLLAKVVWGVPVPPVCTNGWNNKDWHAYMAKFRPIGYEGGIFDKKAWEVYKLKIANENRKDLL